MTRIIMVASRLRTNWRGAQISSGSLVADFCAGLGGTVRYLAHKYGADVTGIEFTPARVAGAQELTRRVGLQDDAASLKEMCWKFRWLTRVSTLSSAKNHFAMSLR